MLKKITIKCLSMLMAILVLVSSTSFAVEQHFCGDNLIDYSVFSEMKKCCATPVAKQKSRLSKEGCCSDKLEVFKGIDLLKFETSEKYSNLSNFVLFSDSFHFSLIYSFYRKDAPHFFTYVPPNLVTDVIIDLQVLLI